MPNTAQARGILTDAFIRLFGREPSLSEIQTAQAVALGESGYGSGWKGDCIGSHNWGALQHATNTRARLNAQAAGEEDPGCPDSCAQTDSNFQGRYPACFQVFDDDNEGADAFLIQLYQRRPTVLQAASRGSLRGVSAAMFDTVYYEGPRETRDQNICWHMTFLSRNLDTVSNALGEPKALSVRASGGSSSSLVSFMSVAVIVGAGAWVYFKGKRN